MNRHDHLKLVSKLFRQQFRSPTLKIVEKYTRNYYAVVKKLQRFQSRCKYFTTASRFLQRNGRNSDIWWKVVIFALKMDVFCTKMIALKFHISSVNQKNDFNAFAASVVEQRLFRKNGRCNFFYDGPLLVLPMSAPEARLNSMNAAVDNRSFLRELE